MRVAAVVLAAGGSRRMGRSKQLLELEGETLVRRAARAALASRADAVWVVTGCDAETVEAELAGLDAKAVRNPGWERGLGSSIACGVAAAVRDGADAVLLALADQPRVDAAHLDALVRAGGADPGAVVATAYRGVRGVPAFFGSAHLGALAALKGDRGARALVEGAGDSVRELPFEPAADDVDTPADWERVRAYSK